jgi:hypothetical protein
MASPVSPSRRVLITCSRSWNDWNRAGRVLGRVYELAPDALLVSGHAWRGDRDLERIWTNLGGRVEVHEADWAGPCRESCRRGHRRPSRDGGDHCPAAGNYRNIDMAELPGIVLFLAFIGPCTKDPCYSELPEPHGSHGATQCATYAQYQRHIPTRRFTDPILQM